MSHALWANLPLCRQLCAAHDCTQHAESLREEEQEESVRWGRERKRMCVELKVSVLTYKSAAL